MSYLEYIINPINNKRVSIYSKKGLNILKKYVSMVGGSNKAWKGSYSCKGLKEQECNNQLNNRCKYVKGKKRQYCRKRQSASKKRGTRNWGKLKLNVMKGGHDGPCAINSKTGRCKKSSVGDSNCEVKNGRCVKVKSKVTKPKPQVTRPKPQVTRPKPKPMVKVTKTKTHGTTKRLSASEYYREHGLDRAIGDRCDIRKNGEYKCLLKKKNNSPYWAKKSKSGKGQEKCEDWSSKCREADFM